MISPSTILTLEGTSMTPTINNSDRLIVSPVPFDQVQVGDVIMFDSVGNGKVISLDKHTATTDQKIETISHNIKHINAKVTKIEDRTR